MKAITYTEYGSPDVLKISEIDKPIPKENEVLIKTKASTVSAVDSIFRKGEQFFAKLATGMKKPKNPILGFEFSGEIESIGNNVKMYKVGDLVCGACEQAHADYICVLENGAIIQKPTNTSFEEAAAIPAGALTALPFLRDAGKIEKDQKILIIGASGSVGTYAVQFAKYYEAEVTSVVSSANTELVKSLGSDYVIDYTREDFTKSGKTYNIIFDTVGKNSFSKSKSSLTKNGIFLTTFISGTILFEMLLTSILSSKKAKIIFTGMRSVPDKAKDLALIKDLVESGKIKPVIDKVYPMEQISEAHNYVDKGHKKGNVVIKF